MDDVRRAIGKPSSFFLRHAERVREVAALGPVLDLACGRGRHSLAAAELGLSVVAVDRNEESLSTLRSVPLSAGSIETRRLDLEGDAPLDLADGAFGAVLVFRYLYRPLMPRIESLLAPGGVLLYETFTTRQRELGWGPSRDDFLLAPGELPTLFPNLDIEECEEGLTDDPRPAETACLLASRSR